jgi:hypothetical protein
MGAKWEGGVQGGRTLMSGSYADYDKLEKRIIPMRGNQWKKKS